MRHAGTRVHGVGRRHPGPSAARMLSLLGAIFRSPARWRAGALVVLVAVITVIEVLLMLRLTTWNADFFDMLERKSLAGVATQAWIFALILAGIMLFQAANLETKMRLQIALRAHLTATVSGAWMADGRHYLLRNMVDAPHNEDGRIAEDARVVCEMVVEFLVSLLYALLQLVLFTGVLWLHSGPLAIVMGGAAVTLPGHMVWVALLYALVGAAITIFVGRSLVRATDRRQAAEADYRAMLVNAVTHAPVIALTGAEPGERRRLGSAFGQICRAWSAQRTSLRNLLFLSTGYGQLTAVLPLLILAPRYFSGEMSLGTLMQVTLAFGQVTAALSWLTGNYASIAQWEASAERVLALHDAVSDIGDAGDEPGGRFVRVQANGPNLTFDNLSVVSPAGDVLCEHFSAEIVPGERVLVEAVPQVAEGLFRAVAGLSLWGAGRIELPDDSVPFFVSERPYLPEATLLEVLAEPRPADHFPAAEVARVLVDVGAGSLVPLLDSAAAWEQEIGIEDQQRLGIARALLHAPRWLLMHEATSALDAAAEEHLMELLTSRLRDTAIVTITHRPTTARPFQRRIALAAPPGGQDGMAEAVPRAVSPGGTG